MSVTYVVILIDVGHRPALRLDERLDRLECSARLPFEVAAAGNGAVGCIRDLAGQEQHRLGLTDLDALAVGRRLEHTRRTELLDRGHVGSWKRTNSTVA